MSLRPIDAYPGKVATPTADYPDGKAQNITSPGDGTGTPWEAALVNDIFGFQQFLTSKAGITPSGTPDNATTSQYFQAVWKLLNVRALTYNIVSDVDLTLTPDQNLYAKVTITDTGVVLTAGCNVIVDNVGRIFIFTNSTAQILTVKTAAGTGVAVPVGGTVTLLNDGVNVTYTLNMAPVVHAATAKATPVDADELPLLDSAASFGLKKLTWANVKATLVTYLSTGTGFAIVLSGSGYIKFPSWLGGLIIQWGGATTVAGGGTITLPIAFPNGHFVTIAVNSPQNGNAITNTYSHTLTNFYAISYTANTAASIASNIKYIAIGY